MIPGAQGSGGDRPIQGAQGELADEQATEAAQGKGGKDAILSEALKRYKTSVELDGENRRNAVDDLAFLAGNQWPPQIKAERDVARRPALTINTLPTYLHQVTNDQRQNTPAISVHPVDSGADIETAKVIQGLIRHIEYDSNAKVARDTAVNCAAAIGFGFLRLVTEYCHETSFDQDIRFRRIRNPLSVRIDPLSQEPDGSDMRWCFVEGLVAREDFQREYPNAEAGNDTLVGQETYSAWITKDSVLVTEYYCIQTTEAKVVMLADGTTAYKDDVPPDAPLMMRNGKPMERDGTRSKVIWRKITAVDILEEAEIPCKWIPVFPVYGDEIDIEGKVTRFGLVRNAKDSCQAYNVWMTAATEEIALRPKAKYIMAEGQEEGHENEWQLANQSSAPFLLYKPTTVDGVIVPPPRREPLADVPTGAITMMMHARDDIKATTGLFDSSLGARGNATSGKQELAQQRQGDTSNFHYADNLSITNRHIGRCIINMIPKVYDTQRVIRILGEKDEADQAEINVRTQDPTGAETVIHDLTVGRYDVTVSNGPSYTTMRQESAEFFANAMQSAKDPATAAVVSYLAIQNQDVPGAEVAAKMMATLLPAPAKAVLDKENGQGEEQGQPVMTSQGPVPAEQAGQLIDQLAQALQQAKEAVQKADEAKAQTELLKQQKEAQELQLRADTEPLEKQIALEEAKARSLEAQAKLQEAEAKLIAARADAIRAEAEAQAAPQRIEIEQQAADRAEAESAHRMQMERAAHDLNERNANQKAYESERSAQMEVSRMASEAQESPQDEAQEHGQAEALGERLEKHEEALDTIAMMVRDLTKALSAPKDGPDLVKAIKEEMASLQKDLAEQIESSRAVSIAAKLDDDGNVVGGTVTTADGKTREVEIG